jgi:hypothetical protein
MKTLREMMNLIEAAQQPVAEGPAFDKWADERAASQLYKLRPGFDGTDAAGRPVDQELVKRQEKYWNQAAKEKKQQELKRSKELRKPGVAEATQDLTTISTERLKAYLAKNWGGGVPAFGTGAMCRRVMAELKRRGESLDEGLGKDLKRLATGKDVKSRAGQEIARAQQASMTGDNKTANKHFKRYDKLDKLANKEQGVAEDQLEETTPDALAKIDELTRK